MTLLDRFHRRHAAVCPALIALAGGAFADPVAERKLPDVLRFGAGQRVSDAGQWPARRAEILELFESRVHGRTPRVATSDVTFETVHIDPAAMAGAATLKEIRITTRGVGGALSFKLVMFHPNKRASKAPAMLLISHRGPENLDPVRATKSGFWPAEQLVARGYAAAAFYAGEIDPDVDDGFKNGIHAVLDPAPPPGGVRAPDAWGTIAAWAWGASRALDYLTSDPALDPVRIGVIGHSRGGKAALWAGATDTRFTLVVSNCSGQSGAALSRGKGGETITRLNETFPHWFCANYKALNGPPELLPHDQHWLLAAIAPRLLYIASAEEDVWADPRSEFLAAVAASPVYELLGRKGIEPKDKPETGVAVHAGGIGYHRRHGSHDLTPLDWTLVMDFADARWGSGTSE